MKNKIASLVLLFMLLISFSVFAIDFSPEETFNSVVVVNTETGVGSGFSVEENLIITNAHVVGNQKNVKVDLYDGTTVKGIVVKKDYDKDLAIIQVEKSLSPLILSEKDVGVGEEVYVIGAPKDMPYTLTKGIVSALDRKIGENSYIQLDASVNPGNSGGPLVDATGNVIGVITLKANNAEGISFAIRIPDVLAFIEDVESDDNLNFEDNVQESDVESQLAYLMFENEMLRIAVIILSLLLIGAVFAIIRLAIRKKEKDPYDFEIEIEE